MEEYSQISILLTKDIDKTIKKTEGIYFTPRSQIKYIIDYLKENLTLNIKSILEPSCGSCEFIKYMDDKMWKCNVTAIERNEQIYKTIVYNKYVNLIVNFSNQDFLRANIKGKFDLIVGNPPYFNINKKLIDTKYYEHFEGRPNIYIIFILKCIELLNEKGVCAFVLPINFLNCIYYNKTREHINNTCKILDIKIYKNDKFIDTIQKTCSLIIQKEKSDNSEYIYERNGIKSFHTKENIKRMKMLSEGKETIQSIGFSVSVGTVVWNQCKDILTTDETQTRLIYSSDLKKDNQIVKSEFKDLQKKNYIQQQGYNDPILIVNRGYGNGDYKFNYAVVDMKNYLIENHLIVIKSKQNGTRKEIIEALNTISKSFSNKETCEFIELYFSNNAMNCREIESIIPIKIT